MAGLLRRRCVLPASRELFLLLCVGDLKRQSNGKILLDHYRYKRRRFAGDERVCHQPVTAMRRAMKWRCSVFLPSSLKKGRLQRFSGERFAPKPDQVTACLATRLHNFPDLESFLRGRPFFMVPPGEVASPFLSTAPAVPAPCVLASFGEDPERPVVGRAVLHRGSAGGCAVVHIVAGSRLRSRAAGLRIAARRVTLRERSGAGECLGCCERNGFSSSWSFPSAHPIRLVNEAAGGGIGWSWHSLFAPRRRTFFEPDHVCD